MSVELSLVVRASALLLTATLVAGAVRKASASLRYAIWTISLCGVLALPLMTSFLPILDLPLLPVERGSAPPTARVPASSTEERQPAAMAETAIDPPLDGTE